MPANRIDAAPTYGLVLDAPGMETPSQLIFELELETEGGTNFTLRHMECSEGAANDLKRPAGKAI